MSKKLNSLADLANLKFDDLAPDPEPQENHEIPLLSNNLRRNSVIKEGLGKQLQ